MSLPDSALDTNDFLTESITQIKAIVGYLNTILDLDTGTTPGNIKQLIQKIGTGSTPASGFLNTFAKSDGSAHANLYTKNAAGLEVAAGVPVGAVEAFAGTVANVPAGWLLCDGSAKSRTEYSALFTALGGSSCIWGIGDGSTTFNLPDLKGVGIRGVGTTTTALYAQQVTVTEAQVIDDKMQEHTHNTANRFGGTPGLGTYICNMNSDSVSAYEATTGSSGRTGDETTGKARGLYYIIKY